MKDIEKEVSQSAHAQCCVVRRRVKCQQHERILSRSAHVQVCVVRNRIILSHTGRKMSAAREKVKKNVSSTRKFSLGVHMRRFV